MRTATSNQRRWYVIQCKPRQESRALEHLERQQFSCYLPTLRAEKISHGRKLEVSEPLFSRFLFVQFDETHRPLAPRTFDPRRRPDRALRQIPLPVEDDIIDTIRRRLGSDLIKVPYLEPGERVQITEGCFSDLEAIFVANDGEERVILLMNILHREQTLSFPASSVRKCRTV